MHTIIGSHHPHVGRCVFTDCSGCKDRQSEPETQHAASPALPQPVRTDDMERHTRSWNPAGRSSSTAIPTLRPNGAMSAAMADKTSPPDREPSQHPDGGHLADTASLPPVPPPFCCKTSLPAARSSFPSQSLPFNCKRLFSAAKPPFPLQGHLSRRKPPFQLQELLFCGKTTLPAAKRQHPEGLPGAAPLKKIQINGSFSLFTSVESYA